MKTHIVTTAAFVLLSIFSNAQSVAINADATVADASAMLDVKSTTKGLLTPRMTTAERQAVLLAATGLLVFDTDTLTFWFFNGTNWIELGSGSLGGFWLSNGNDIYNTNTGNVGIGTSTPTARLTLVTDINTAGWSHIGQFGGVDSIIVGEGIGGVSAAVGTSTEHAFRLTAGALGRVQIYPTGDVVIGDNNVGSYGKFTVKTTNNTYGISHLGDNGNILATRMGGTSAGFGTFSNTHMRIFCNTRSDIFISSATGNVGIGYENFGTYKLAVNGTIRAKELRINTGWADYVFAKNYKLMPLAEVEKFIKNNNRLPGIASAKKLKKEGVGISEMQTKMMAKIEELTLYMIEANKTIEALKQRLEAVEKANR